MRPEYLQVLKLQTELRTLQAAADIVKAKLDALRFPCIICKAMILPGDTCERCEREGC